jgi:hypothetical protein
MKLIVEMKNIFCFTETKSFPCPARPEDSPQQGHLKKNVEATSIELLCKRTKEPKHFVLSSISDSSRGRGASTCNTIGASPEKP